MFNNKLMDLPSSYNYLESVSRDNGGSSYGNNILDIQYDLQIIIAAYNCEHTIKQCLHSIVSQKTNYHYIIKVVDDGSTDNTGVIIDRIAKTAANLKVIHQKNMGLSGARNTGLNRIQGKYVLFVDSDDTLPEDAVENLLDYAYRYDGDIVERGYNVFNNDGEVVATLKHSVDSLIDPFTSLYGYPWGKVYKSHLFKNVVFPEKYWFEDTVAMYRIWPNAKKVFTIDNITYNYRDNPHGITATFGGKPKSLDTLWITQKLLSECEVLDERVYNFTLSQIIMNTQRLMYLSDKINRANFVISKHLIAHYFPSYKTDKKSLLKVEYALKNQGKYIDFLNSVYEL